MSLVIYQRDGIYYEANGGPTFSQAEQDILHQMGRIVGSLVKNDTAAAPKLGEGKLKEDLKTIHISPVYISGSWCYVGNCGGGGNEACAVAMLILAALTAFVAAVVMFVVSGIQAGHAAEARGQMDLLKKKPSENSDVDQARHQLIDILQEKYTKRSLQATYSGVIGGGLVLLCTALVLVIIAYFKATPVNSVARDLAISGGAIATGGIAAHIIHKIVDRAKSGARSEKYTSILTVLANQSSSTDKTIQIREIPKHYVQQDIRYYQVGDRVFSYNKEENACYQVWGDPLNSQNIRRGTIRRYIKINIHEDRTQPPTITPLSITGERRSTCC